MVAISSQSVSIRDARLGDLETIVRFNKELARESEGLRLEDAVIRAGVRRALTCPELCRYFVAEMHGQIVGQTMITYELTDWRDGLVYWIQSVYVLPEYRRFGVFRRLHGHVVALARELGEARMVRLYVEKDNEPAIKAYERIGMKPAHFHIYETVLT